jgi:nitrite reductase (cytochrome c-552)
MWNQGIHARSGVACADCHMPYTREGALKISDHHVRSPLLNVNNACQTCHKWPEAELLARVEKIQDRTVTLRNRAMDALMDLITTSRRPRRAGPATPTLKWRGPRSAVDSSTWTSWSRRTPTASMRPRKR